MHEPARRPLRVLLADDDEDDRLLVREALREAGLRFDLRCVTDGRELLEDLRRADHPDVILLDLNMPRMNGREALAALRASPDLQNIPVVVLTTSRADADAEKTRDLGVCSFVSKPVSFSGLVDIMRGLGRRWAEAVSG